MEWLLPLISVPPSPVNPSLRPRQDAHLITDPVWQPLERDSDRKGSPVPAAPSESPTGSAEIPPVSGLSEAELSGSL